MVVPVLALNGCATPSFGPNVTRRIIGVTSYWTTKPWLSFDTPPTNIPGGFKFVLYLTGANSRLGVFGDGLVHVDMYRIDRSATGGKSDRQHVRRWSFTTEEAYAYRARRAYRLGHGYGFRLDWGAAAVLGEEIMVVPAFERKDGQTIFGQPKYLKVPLAD